MERKRQNTAGRGRVGKAYERKRTYTSTRGAPPRSLTQARAQAQTRTHASTQAQAPLISLVISVLVPKRTDSCPTPATAQSFARVKILLHLLSNGTAERTFQCVCLFRDVLQVGLAAAKAPGGGARLAPAGVYGGQAITLGCAHGPLAQGHHEPAEHLGDVAVLEHDRREGMVVYQGRQHLPGNDTDTDQYEERGSRKKMGGGKGRGISRCMR